MQDGTPATSADRALEPAIVPTETALHGAARRATLALLVGGSIAAIALVAWSLYVRWTQTIADVGRAGVASGLRLAAQIDSSHLALAGGGAVAALALAYAIRQGQRWAYLAVALGAGVATACVWYGRDLVVKLEYPGYVSRSPWVAAATTVAIACTVYLAIVSVTAVTAWLTQRTSARPHA